jgi:hypothetical protein
MIYGLFIHSTNQWMEDNNTIEHYAALVHKIGVKVILI